MLKTKTFKPNIKNLDQIPLTGLSNDYNDLLTEIGPENLRDSTSYEILIEQFASKFQIAKNSDWFWGQASARIAATALPIGSDGLYSAKKWYLETIKNDSVLHALCILAKYSKRSTLVDKQVERNKRDYCALVPIFMAAHKKINNIPYEKWNKAELKGVVEPKLLDAMFNVDDDCYGLGSDELLEYREEALLIRTGAKAGGQRNPATTYLMYPPKDNPLNELPALSRIMLCQTWCAHPSNRTNLMILDPRDWDNMPAPLVETNLFTSTTENDDSWAL